MKIVYFMVVKTHNYKKPENVSCFLNKEEKSYPIKHHLDYMS